MPTPRILLINGASGSGKTALAEALVSRIESSHWIHPDGLWHSTPTMSAENILVQATELALQHRSKSLCIIDCQIRPGWLPRLFDQLGVLRWTNVLLNCPRELREQRLLQRGSGTHDFARIHAWAGILLEEARSRGDLVSDTSMESTGNACGRIIERLGMQGPESGT